MKHSQIQNRIQTMLTNHYGNSPTTLVGTEGYLIRTAADLNGHAIPDCIVAFGVEAVRLMDEANGYVVDEVGKPPDVVIEVASPSTGRRDYTVKRQIYRDAGAGEFWRFDRTGGRYHDAPLAGDILVDGEYRRIPVLAYPDGTFRGYSPALDLYLVWDDGDLQFFDPKVGEFLPDPFQSKRERDEAVRAREESDRRAAADRRRAAADRQRAEESDRRAESERAARAEADRRAAEAEAELERLRRLIAGSE